ncbi:CoA-binding protein [Clostridium ljungdahlii]|uniref:CoA-binding domain-containing protein n=1 Tax=Clostridium ljungdahlii TaxID=1538 RepID=A0A168LE28_9CLOT|nr:CoA-binding protein [Clostridium ljungdahlii]OAA83031.1 hypothetical protein WY13_03807 [Clostridium ljungdahlii]
MEAANFLYYKNWVVVGDVSNEEKYAFKILSSLKGAMYNAEGVNPRDASGKVYRSLSEIPFKVDVLDLCINPKTGIDIVKKAFEIGIDKILIQPGAESEEILNFCSNNAIDAVKGCALVELTKKHKA